MLFVRRFALGEGDEDEDDAERNCGFSYGKFTRDRFETFFVFFRVPFPLSGGESKYENKFFFLNLYLLTKLILIND